VPPEPAHGFPWRDDDTEYRDRRAIAERFQPSPLQLAFARLQPDPALRKAIANYRLHVVLAGPRLLGAVADDEYELLTYGQAATIVDQERADAARALCHALDENHCEDRDPWDAWVAAGEEEHVFLQSLVAVLPQLQPATADGLADARTLDDAELHRRVNVAQAVLGTHLSQRQLAREAGSDDLPRLVAESSAAIVALDERYPEDRARTEGQEELAQLIEDTREWAAFHAGVLDAPLAALPPGEGDAVVQELTERATATQPLHVFEVLANHVHDQHRYWTTADHCRTAEVTWAAANWTPPTWQVPDTAPAGADPSEVGSLPTFQEVVLAPEVRAFADEVRRCVDQHRPEWRELGIRLPSEGAILYLLAADIGVTPEQLATSLITQQYEQLCNERAAAATSHQAAEARLTRLDSTLAGYSWWGRLRHRDEFADLTAQRADCLADVRATHSRLQAADHRLAAFPDDLRLAIADASPDWTSQDEQELRQVMTELFGPPRDPTPERPDGPTVPQDLEPE
jgi:hypothetical protein